jgi:alkylation response protein AidB-like acyl-CoA dehydrogenase
MLNFTLDAEQQAVSDMARDFANDRIAPHAIRWDEEKHFPVDVLREAASLGMGGITVAPEWGGSGLARLDCALIIEGLATGCPTIAAYVSIHNMVAGLIDRFGDAQQRASLLPNLCSMDWLASYCLTEPGSGSDAAALRMRARRDGAEYVLDGVKQFISGAGVSDLYVVMARTGGEGPKGISAFLVQAGTPGLSFGPDEKKMGWRAQPTRQVILDSARVPAANRLGAEGEGFRIAMAGLDGGRLNIGASSLGGAQSALDRACRYAGERRAFGQKLFDHQTVQFRLAEMTMQLESARTFLWRAATALDAGQADATRLCAMAKWLATDTGFTVANAALQIHGGYGYLVDYGIEKIVRDLRVHQILEGTNEIMHLIVARGLREGVRQ